MKIQFSPKIKNRHLRSAAALREWRCFGCFLQNKYKNLLNRAHLGDLKCGVGGDFLGTLGWFSGSFHGVLGDFCKCCVFFVKTLPNLVLTDAIRIQMM